MSHHRNQGSAARVLSGATYSVLAGAVALALGASSVAHADAGSDTTIGGKMYVDFTNIDQTKNDSDTANAGSGLDVKRFYLTVNHKFDDFWSASITTDFNYSASTGETQLFVKKAFVEAKWSDAFKLRAGADDQPWIPFVEGLYGMRYVENTVVDKSKFGNSSDWGLHVGGSGDGNFWNYAVAAVNGGGFKNPTRTNSIDVEGRLAIQPFPGLTVAAGGYSGSLGKDVANLASGTSTRTASRQDFLVAYNNKSFRVGGEYFNADNYGGAILNTAPKDSADGYSVWGAVVVAPDISVFGRYDNYKPSKDINPSLKDTYYNAGVEWAVRKGIKLSAVYKHDKLDDNSGSNNTKTNEIGVWGEVAF